MFLFLRDDFPQHFAKREFPHRVRLSNPLSIIHNRDSFVFEVELEHILRFTGDLHFFRLIDRCPVQIIDLLRDLERVL